ncbi:major facilitator superfamily transporter [Colletotrichum navitas]|uniref:Major facilitator superfamily transporter n=1 Tax=Colletotrichum navitas TaxID=681940 RepID=A0AAD8UZB0_9PEZI|nr:major facilitator superfamily transporter [Colletotrichum navitas]KAK1573462.1 major facilitator superfamily transporter [Colletotrichum navitas]
MAAVATLEAQGPRQNDTELNTGSVSHDELSWTSDSHGHPRTWGRARKTYDTCWVIFLEFYTGKSSNHMSSAKTILTPKKTPVAAHVHRDLGVSPVLATFLFVSTYLMGQALGGVFLPPWSESFGRKKPYIVSTAIYSLTCVLVAACPTIPAIVVGRVVGGFLSAIPAIVAAGSIEDLWDTQDRVWWVFWWAVFGNIGLLAGGVISDLIISAAHWTWVFYTAAIVNACMTAILFTIKESRPSVVLAKTIADNERTGSSQVSGTKPKNTPIREKLDIVRPLRFLFTEPIVFLVSVVSAIAFGLIYLFTEVLPHVYVSMGLKNGWKNTPFLALALGILASGLTRIYDARTLATRSAKGLPITPESKLGGFIIGAPLLAGGLWCFAWTIPPAVLLHWAVPTAALVPIGYAVNEYDYVLAGYLTDCYETYTASAFAALGLTRALLCATFPLLGSVLYHSVDPNKASSIFAVLATVLCIVPPLFLRYGRWLRNRSPFIGI